MKIALLGDIAFFGKFSLVNNDNLRAYFKEVAQLLSKYDLVIGNLETPFVLNSNTYGFKSAYIKSDPVNVEILKLLNIKVINLANNHIYDFGKEGYNLTKKVLTENDIQYFGVENDQLLYKYQENTLALNGYCCYSTNPLGINTSKRDGINPLNFLEVENCIRQNSKEDHLNIVSVHCGQEHVNYPNYDHIEMARKLAYKSSYVFYGHHPHVAQGIEKVNNSLIAYSLGNFCFDDVYTSKSINPLIKQSENNKESFILELVVENNILISHSIVPIYLAPNKMEIGSPAIKNKINNYSKKLSLNKEDYIAFRNNLLKKYIDSRKEMRDFNWYLKRFNHRSFFMIKAGRSNYKKYLDNVKKYL